MRRAFTFLEMLLVIGMLGLLCGAAVVKLGPLITSASVDDTLARLIELDHNSRRRSRIGGERSQLIFDLNEQRAFRLKQGTQVPQAVVKLRNCTLLQVVQRDLSLGAGQAEIRVSSAGLTATYALHIRSQDGRERWLLVSGLTGTYKVVDEKRQIELAFGALQDRVDAR